jgi:phage-related protein
MWIGDSKHDVPTSPGPVKASFGHRLQEVQDGKTLLNTKCLPTIGAGVPKLRKRYDGDAFRAVYVVSRKRAV